MAWTGAAVGVAALAAGCGDSAGNLDIATIHRGNIEKTVTALGKVEPREYVDVGAQVSGQLTRLLVKAGDHVRAGGLLAEIDPRLPAAKVAADEAELARLRAELADAEAQSDYATGEYHRQQVLARSNATREDIKAQALRNMRSAVAQVGEVRAQIEQTQSTLAADRTQLGYTRIYAPITGTVVSITAREGQTLNANYSTPVLMRIADLATMTVWTQVSEADVTSLRVGMPLYFTTLGFGERRWNGTLRQILPAPLSPLNGTASADTGASSPIPSPGVGNVVLYTALFDVANPTGELRPDMSAQVFFITASAHDALIVPTAALEPPDGASGGADRSLYLVQVLVDGRLAQREVRIGVRTRFAAQVLSGLEAGDLVVTGRKSDTGHRSLVGFRL